jgi:hypothetical protein
MIWTWNAFISIGPGSIIGGGRAAVQVGKLASDMLDYERIANGVCLR